MQVKFREAFEIKRSIFLNVAKEKYSFYTLDDVTFTFDSIGIFTGFCEADMTENFMQIATGNIRVDEIDLSVLDEIKKVSARIKSSKDEVIETLVYMLDWYELEKNDVFAKGIEYSLNGEDFHKITGGINAEITIYPKHNISPSLEGYIQRSLTGDYWKPLQAFDYLHKAKREKNNNHKWINATIAAELAIKEFLIKNQPGISVLILEMPSPPLHKLYGVVLESFYGERSPKLSELNNGASVRNNIIHRPNEIKVEKKAIEKYIKDVEYAIFHLISLEYGHDILIDSYLAQNG